MMHQNNFYLLIGILIITCVCLIYFSYLDFSYREMKRRYLLLLYPLEILASYLIWGDWKIVFICGFSMFIVFTILDFISQSTRGGNAMGTIDILVQPICCLWLGPLIIFYTILMFVFWNLFKVKAIKVRYDRLYKGEENLLGVPLVPVCFLAWIISLGIIIFTLL